MTKAIRLALGCVLVLIVSASASAQSAVFIVRHAERADTGMATQMMADDPDLSAAGRQRADALAAVLKDAGITDIFATEYKRTQQTAGPLARELRVKVTTVPAKETASLIEKLRDAKGDVLVVAHSNSVPDILKGLGVSDSVKIGESEYDNLLVVVRSATPTLIRLHYR